MLIFFLVLLLSWRSEGSPYFPENAFAPVHSGAQELSAASCKGCHQKVYADWSQSRHASAFINQNFQEGYFRETQDRCLFCHAPLIEQIREIKNKPQLKLSREGVNCIACHVRGGEIQSPNAEGQIYHSFKKNTFLKDPKFCASCHEFNINSNHNGKLDLTPINAQSTWSEWQSYQKAGGQKTCQGCHMTQGRHEFHGAHERKNSPLKVKVQRIGSWTVFNLKTIDVGHNFPSGDVFRRVTFEVRGQKDKQFRIVKTFQREYSHVRGFRLLKNTTIRPHEKVSVRVQEALPFEYRLIYHFMKDSEKQHSHTNPSERERWLTGGTIKE